MADPRACLLLAPGSVRRLVLPAVVEPASPLGLVEIGVGSGNFGSGGAGAFDSRSRYLLSTGRARRCHRLGAAPNSGPFTARPPGGSAPHCHGRPEPAGGALNAW